MNFIRLITLNFFIGSLLCFAKATAQPPPSPVPSPSLPEGEVKNVVDQALGRGGKVIMKRVDYNTPGDETNPIRSKTYIEIDTRTQGASDADLVESQKKVEQSQVEMMKALDAIGTGQTRQDSSLGSVEGRARDIAGGMKSEARDQSTVRSEADSATAGLDDTDRDSEKIIKQLNDQNRKLSGSVDELSSRINEAGGPLPVTGDK